MKKYFFSKLTFLITLNTYRLICLLMFPFLFCNLFFKKKNNSFSELNLRFFGLISENSATKNFKLSKIKIWIHAVSIGETNAAIPLIRSLMDNNREIRILLTNSTESGFKFYEESLGKENSYNSKIIHSYIPYDFSWAVKNFLNFFNPHSAVFIETEIWPNFIFDLNDRDIKIILANGRLSNKSLSRFQRLSWLSKPIMEKFSLILAQSKTDLSRFNKTGKIAKCLVSGNLKFDAKVNPKLVSQGKSWKNIIPKTVWLALSTRFGEEEKIFRVWAKFKPKKSLLIVVPRHPHRFDSVYSQANNMKLKVKKRSNFFYDDNECKNFFDADVIVGDSVGEITTYATIADIALIGGSIPKHGGQNPIEICSQGCPVFFGPHMYNFYSIARALNLTEAGFQINSYQDWITEGSRLILDKKKFSKSKTAAYRFAESGKGASTLSAKEILKLFNY